jgi:hypothetical protein
LVGTVRGRVGYLWGDGAVLTYLTGGLAYGEIKINGTTTVSGHADVSTCCSGHFSVTQAFGPSQVNTGWVVGYGMEGKLLIPGWTYRIEGLYMDLGTLDSTGVTSGASSRYMYLAQLYSERRTGHHALPFHRHHPSRWAELSIPLI